MARLYLIRHGKPASTSQISAPIGHTLYPNSAVTVIVVVMAVDACAGVAHFHRHMRQACQSSQARPIGGHRLRLGRRDDRDHGVVPGAEAPKVQVDHPLAPIGEAPANLGGEFGRGVDVQ